MSKHDDESCCGVRIWIYLLSGIFAIAFVFLIGISVVGILNASCTYTYSQGNSYAYNCQNNQLVYYPAIVVLLFFLLVLIWLFISTCTRSRIGYMVFIVVACIFLLMEISGILTFLIFWIISLFHQFSSFNDFTSAIGQTYLSIIITVAIIVIILALLIILTCLTCKAHRAESRRQTNILIDDFNRLFVKP